jgi:dipeptidyl aminopeptidase/acylaminoacyl peptidase
MNPGTIRTSLLTGLLVALSLFSWAAASSKEDSGEPHKAMKKDGSWDVSGTFGPVKTIKFSSDKGTWMHLDVHPDGNLIVFDMLGDLYTVPMDGGKATRITKGAAYDFQARFSPDGKKLLFTSDRGGGLNVWAAGFTDGELEEPKAVIEEKKKIIDGARWDPSGDWIYVRKRTTDTSSLGVSAVWAYHVDGGSGIELVGSDQVGEVDSFSATRDGRWLYLGTKAGFSYGQDPYGAIWRVQRYDRQRGSLDPVNVGLGSSAVPLLSPDEKMLAFIRRVDGKTTLWLHDIASGAERQIWGCGLRAGSSRSRPSRIPSRPPRSPSRRRWSSRSTMSFEARDRRWKTRCGRASSAGRSRVRTAAPSSFRPSDGCTAWTCRTVRPVA